MTQQSLQFRLGLNHLGLGQHLRLSKNRGRYDRSKLRYPSDLTDDEWRLVEPLIPPGRRGGGKRTVIMQSAGPSWQTSAAGSLQQTESRFVDYREAFFNSIDPTRRCNKLHV